MLAEVVGTHIATMRQGRRSFTEAAPEALEPALRFLVNAMWTAMHHDQQVPRVLLRDLDRSPELLDQVWTQVRTCGYDELANWLRDQRDRGRRGGGP